MHWRLLLTPPLPGADNMALDEALMARARQTGESVLRVYEWSAPTLSLGRNQRAAGLYDVAAAARAGVAFVRRATGGRALLHHREITYSITAPAERDASIRESYESINRLLIDGLSRLGVRASPATGRGTALAPGVTPCFEVPAKGELVVGGRKLVGSAQWRDAGALLQHGSMLVDDDQSLAVSLLRSPVPPPARPATLREAMGRAPDAAEVMEALATVLRERRDGECSTMEVDGVLAANASGARSRYLSDEWTWRR